MNKDDLILALCKAVLADRGLVDQRPWVKLIVVGVAGPGHSRMFGYRFDEAGEWTAVSPDDGHAQDAVKRLQQCMLDESPGGKAWLACQIRIASDGRYGVDFEYADPNRWTVTPRNLERRIAEFAAVPI